MGKKCCSIHDLLIVCESDKKGRVTQFYECSKCHKKQKEIQFRFFGPDELTRKNLQDFLKNNPTNRLVRENKIPGGISVGLIKYSTCK